MINTEIELCSLATWTRGDTIQVNIGWFLSKKKKNTGWLMIVFLLIHLKEEFEQGKDRLILIKEVSVI